jgi:5,10-methylenetetrahydromethanopterin reductase
MFATCPDSAVAKEAARSTVGIHASSMSEERLRRDGVDPGELEPVVDAIAAGDLARGIELTTPQLADRLPIAGTPAECAERIRAEIAPAGVNHVIRGITDRAPVRAFTGRDLAGAADVNTQLRLIHDEVMPAFA